mmetsp:Transcript_35843/g.66025  ORF Transcript_35843/g.66025 Transcript_35843/m.66025 type:complete len:237 (+) Transcript_35843:55-765(+)
MAAIMGLYVPAFALFLFYDVHVLRGVLFPLDRRRTRHRKERSARLEELAVVPARTLVFVDAAAIGPFILLRCRIRGGDRRGGPRLQERGDLRVFLLVALDAAQCLLAQVPASAVPRGRSHGGKAASSLEDVSIGRQGRRFDRLLQYAAIVVFLKHGHFFFIIFCSCGFYYTVQDAARSNVHRAGLLPVLCLIVHARQCVVGGQVAALGALAQELARFVAASHFHSCAAAAPISVGG